jgi:hypothetical protein
MNERIDVAIDDLWCLAHGKPTTYTVPELALVITKWFNEATYTRDDGGPCAQRPWQYHVDSLSELVADPPVTEPQG